MANKLLGFLVCVVGVFIALPGGFCVFIFGFEPRTRVLQLAVIGFVAVLFGSLIIKVGVDLMRSPSDEGPGQQ